MKKVLLLIVLFGLIFITTSCQKSEEVTVSKYFQAMRHNDKDTMSSMAAEPKHLEYKSYKIVSIDEPLTLEYDLPALIQKLDESKKEKNNLALEAGDKRDDVEDLKDELEETRRASKKRELRKKIEEAEVAFYQAEQGYKDLVKKIGELKKKIEFERNIINLSTGIKKNAEMFQGVINQSVVRTNVTLNNDTQNEYVFVLRKYVFMINEKERPCRWIILKILSAEEYEKEMKEVQKDVPPPTEEVTEETPAEEKDETPGEN
jgi:hypothetical protein